MKTILLALLLVLVVKANADDNRVPLRDVMSLEQYNWMGLGKLTVQERINLETWLAIYRQRLVAAKAQSGQNAAATSSKVESGSKDIITVSEIDKRILASIGVGGKVMQLNNGRVFSSNYGIESKNWVVGQTIVVRPRDGTIYLLNATTGTEEMVHEVKAEK